MYTSPLFLLQGLGSFRIESNPVQGIIFLVGIALIVLAVIYLNKSKNIQNSSVFKTGTFDIPDPGNPENKNFHKMANRYGLGNAEQNFLKNIFRREKIALSTFFDSQDSIDAGFATAIRALSSEEESDDDIAKLYTIRNKIEYGLSAAEEIKNTAERLNARWYKRKKTDIPVSFYLVVEKEEQAGAKKIKRLSLDSVKHTGNMLDISSGGCALNTRGSYKTGARLKLEFKIGKTSGAALAHILRINQNQVGNVLHVRFLKVPVKSQNTINAYVFNYTDVLF
ncbi:MAG: PilZ domain-containing protein [Spirochaetaceae bacterium]|jgi:hypothetical protein|nr:PilZ domain-containing protein [Spirochaetaceae bacterium]